jgi:membrane-associated phospholipid phosphatase
MPKKLVRKTTQTQPFKSHRLQLSMAIILFVVTTLAVDPRSMAPWEISLFQFVYDLPEWMRPVFIVVTQLGSITMLAALALVYLAKSHYAVVIRLLMSGLTAYLAAGVAKDLFGRGRPQDFLADLIYRDHLIRGPGYPSGHMALATAMGLTLWHYLPRKYRWVSPVLIVGVGLSRIYLGVHAPLDIVGGFAIGWATFAVFHFVRLTDIRPKKA